MYKAIKIKNFKVLRDTSFLKLGRFTLLTGVNGRGKSSFLQSLLLLSQTLYKTGSLTPLLPNGIWIDMGSFKQLMNIYSGDDFVEVQLVTDSIIENEFCLHYKLFSQDSNYGELTSLRVNGRETIFDSGEDDMEESLSSVENENGIAFQITDSVDMMRLGRIFYVAANRKTVAFDSTDIIVDRNILMRPDASNVLEVLATFDNRERELLQKCMSDIFDGALIEIDVDEKTNRACVFMDSVSDGQNFQPVHVGYGFGYVLSLLVLGIRAKEGDTIIVENPEAHLHPTAQSKLLRWFLNVIIRKNVQIIMESHSDHVVNTALLSIKNGLPVDDVQMLFFDWKNPNDVTEGVCPINLEITSSGVVRNPPKGFCDQYVNDIEALMGL